MSLYEKTRKTLAEIGVSDVQGVESLFAEVRAAMEAERQDLVARGATSEAERNQLCKALRDRWLARKNGLVSSIDENWLKKASKDLKPAVGREFNQLRHVAESVEIERLVRDVGVGIRGEAAVQLPKLQARAAGLVNVEVPESPRDLTLPGYRRPLGSIHPVTRVMREIEDIFLNLGFAIETGPEVESVYYNFDALNIPESHPARDDWDTLYVDAQTVLRAHTSPVQIRAMEKHGAPLYIIIPG